MNLLFPFSIAPSYMDGGGVGRRVVRMARELERLGIGGAQIIQLFEGNLLPGNNLVHKGADLFSYHRYENRYSVISRFYSGIRKPVDIAFLNGDALAYEVSVHLRHAGTRILSVLCGDSPYYYAVNTKYRDIIDLHIGLTESISENLAKTFGTRTNIVTVNTGVEVPDHFPNKACDGVLELVFLGRLNNITKAVERSVLLLKLLLARDINYHMTFAGEGDYRSMLENDLRDLIVSDRVTFTGHIDEVSVRSLLSRSHLFLLFSRTEGLPNALLEAMAFGVVPVAMECSGVNEVIQKNINGFIVPQGDVEHMAEVIERLYADQNLVREVGKAAYQRVKDHFNIQKSVQAYRDIFELLYRSGPYTGAVPPISPCVSRLDKPWLPNALTVGLRSAKQQFKTGSSLLKKRITSITGIGRR